MLLTSLHLNDELITEKLKYKNKINNNEPESKFGWCCDLSEL